MERRVLIAIFLSFIVLYAYQAFVVKPVPKPSQAASAPSQATKSPAASPATSALATPATAAALRPAATTLASDSAERDVRIETHDVIATITNRRARLESCRLKHHPA